MDWRIVVLALAVVILTFCLSQLLIHRSSDPLISWIYLLVVVCFVAGMAFYLGTEHKVKYRTYGDCNPKITTEDGKYRIFKKGDCDNLDKIYLNGTPLN